MAAVAPLGVNGAAIVDSHACLHSRVVLVVLLVVVTAASVRMFKRAKWAEVGNASFIKCAIIPVNKPPGLGISDAVKGITNVLVCVQ